MILRRPPAGAVILRGVSEILREAYLAVKPVNDSLKEQCEKDHATIAKLIWPSG